MNERHPPVTLDRLDERLANFAERTKEDMTAIKKGQQQTNNELNTMSTRLTQLEARERERNGHVLRLVEESERQKKYTNELAAEVGRMEEETEVTALVKKTRSDVWVSQIKFAHEAFRLLVQGGVLAGGVYLLKLLNVI